MNRKHTRFTSLFLSTAIALSMAPTSVFAGYVTGQDDAVIGVDFKEPVQEGQIKDAVLEFDVGNNLTNGFVVSFDMTYRDGVDIDSHTGGTDNTLMQYIRDINAMEVTSDVPRSITPTWNYDDVENVGLAVSSTQSFLNKTVAISVPLADNIPAGYYTIDVSFKNWEGDAGEKFISMNDGSAFKTTATLTVLNSDGSLPDDNARYTVNKSHTGAGVVTVSPETDIDDGDTVTITADPDDGENVISVNVTDGSGLPITVTPAEGDMAGATDETKTYTFKMPASDANVAVEFSNENNANTYYNIVANINNPAYGDLVFEGGQSTAKAGTEITFEANLRNGDIEVKDITCVTTDGGSVPAGTDVPITDNNDGTYTFTMPAANVTINANFGLKTEQGEYGLTLVQPDNGVASLNDCTKADEGDTVTVYVKANTGFTVDKVEVTRNDTGDIISVTNAGVTSNPGFNQYIEYTFEMPDSAVTIKPIIVDENDGGDDGSDITGQDGFLTVYGTVVNQNGQPLANATVTVTPVGGGASVTTTTNDKGEFQAPEVSAKKSYNVVASYDTGVIQGVQNSQGTIGSYICYSKTHEISAVVEDADGKHHVSEQHLEVNVHYDWDITNDNLDNNGATGDSSIDDIGTERIYAGADGQLLTKDDYYIHVVPDENNTKVYVYPAVDGNKNFVQGDDTNKDDYAYYNWTVAEGAEKQKVYVNSGYKPGIDKNGQSNDYYLMDVDKNPDTALVEVFIAGDGVPATSDDYYEGDVNGDGNIERVIAGADGWICTEDDYYVVDKDKNPSTTDDNYTIFVGKDTIAGTQDDWYMGNADGHGTSDNLNDDQIFIGDDKIPGTSDDYYLRDVNADGENEKIYAGNDGIFNTSDDYYEANIPHGDETGTIVQVHPGATDDDSDPFEFGRPNDHFEYTVGGKPVDVSVGDDLTAGTSDDVYPYDVVKPGTAVDSEGNPVTEPVETVEVTVNVGADGIPGTKDDTYQLDADLDGENETVHVGTDGIPGTNDDYYEKDVNGDGVNEVINVGNDGIFDTGDDYYEANIPYGDENGTIVQVHPGSTGDENDAFDFGRPNDHFEYTVGGKPVDVSVGEDLKAGTSDDVYPYDVVKPGTAVDNEGNPVTEPVETVEVIVNVGADGIPGTKDDTYQLDADLDGENETVHVGTDGVPGTNDDYYEKDVNGDGKPERVEVGTDGIFSTPDDNYDAIVKLPEDLVGEDGKDTVKVPVYAGEDGIFSDPNNSDSDDWYPWDTNEDGKTDPDIYDGDDTHDKVFIDGDSLAGTDDDYYYEDVNNDGKDEQVFVGPDTIPGTEDDYYYEDVNGDGKDEEVTAGDDTNFGTDDDYYPIPDQDNDGDEEHVFPGADGELGTEDDYYIADVDGDGEDETVYVGPDEIGGTEDDWYYAKITFDAGSGTVNGQAKWSALTSEIKELPTASRSGSYVFSGWTTVNNSSNFVTLNQVLGFEKDTVLYAYYKYTGSTGGGSTGGGGGGVTPITKYTVTFNSKGGSSVPSQTVEKNSTVKKPTDPTREDYIFTGWFTDADCEKAYNFSTKVTKSFTLYAGWKADVTDEDKNDNGDGNNNGVIDNVEDLLQVYPHIAYIEGYEDGTVGPNKNMTRAEAAQIFYRLLNADTRAKYQTNANNFTDVDSSAWYNTAVSTLANVGIIEGYEDGSFGPSKTMTRAEFATICARIGELTPEYKSSFVDVTADHWAYKFIISAADNNWVVGYGDGKFGPNDTITRAQVVTILNRVLGRTPLSENTFKGQVYKNWTDNQDSDAWYYLDMIEAGTSHTCAEDDANGVEIWDTILKD